MCQEHLPGTCWEYVLGTCAGNMCWEHVPAEICTRKTACRAHRLPLGHHYNEVVFTHIQEDGSLILLGDTQSQTDCCRSKLWGAIIFCVIFSDVCCTIFCSNFCTLLCAIFCTTFCIIFYTIFCTISRQTIFWQYPANLSPYHLPINIADQPTSLVATITIQLICQNKLPNLLYFSAHLFWELWKLNYCCKILMKYIKSRFRSRDKFEVHQEKSSSAIN